MGGLLTRRRTALLAAVLAACALAPQAAAGVRSTITFGPAQQNSDVILISGSGGGGDQGQSLDLRTLPSTSLPSSLSFEVPAGYKLDLSAAPGTAVATAALNLVSVDSASFATGLADLVSKNPLDYVADPAAQACAPGTHAAAWHASVGVANQQVDLTVFADAGGADGAAYTLQLCLGGLSPGSSRLVTDISLLDLEPLAAPAAPGRYLWHAFVTPSDGQAYELQALVPLPESVRVRATYDRKRRVAHVAGRVVEGGEPAAGVQVFVDLTPGDEPLFGKTKADGTFSFRAGVKRTTQLDATVLQSVGPCAGTSRAPGGCLSAITVPPDDGNAILWVSPPGGAVRATRPADQRRAEQEDVKAADLPAGAVDGGESDGLACENPTHESDLTITGESSAPDGFALLGGDEKNPSIFFVRSHVRVFRTAKQARAAFRREATGKTARCEFKAVGLRQPEIRPARLAGAGRVRAFRAPVDFSDTVRGRLDTVFLQRGRSVAIEVFIAAGPGSALEQPLVRKLVARLR